MSENPLADVDMEISAVTRSFSTAFNRLPAAGVRRAGQGRAVRQTKPPSRRQMKTMTTGQLTKYMWTTHRRGMDGDDVTGESRRISAELDRRGMPETRQQWDSLADQRPGRPDRTRIPREPVAETAGEQAVRPGQTSVETTVQTTEQTSSHHVMSPGVAAASSALAVAGTVAAADALEDAVNARTEQLGLAQPAPEITDSPDTSQDDLADVGADVGAVAAAGFGAAAVTGDLGQALADESTPGSADLSVSATDEQAQTTQADQSAGAEL